jgi:hypothetical protein
VISGRSSAADKRKDRPVSASLDGPEYTVKAHFVLLIIVYHTCSKSQIKLVWFRRHRNQVPEHNDLMSNTRCQARLMGVTPVKMVPGNPLGAVLTLLQARLHRLTARVPRLLG